MIYIEIDGVKYEGFTSVSVYKSLENVSGSFSFATTIVDTKNFPLKRSSVCKIYVGDIAIINGYIDTVSISYSSEGHDIYVEGRDKLSDVVDSTVIGLKEFTAPITLESIIRTTLDSNNLSSVKIINKAGAIAPFEEGDNFTSEIGETVFSFLEKYAQKRQVLLYSDGLGNLVLGRSGVDRSKVAIQNIKNNPDNNILSCDVSYSSENLFHKYKVVSQLDTGALSFGADIKNSNAVDQEGEAIDNTIRTTRQIEIPFEGSDNSVNLQNLATWYKNIRQARSLSYNVVLQGLFQDKNKNSIWLPNSLVYVNDEFSSINSDMLISAVTYSLNLESGTTTTLKLVNKDVYTLESDIESANIDEGDDLIFDF